jgi:tetratricopeptide (TPR) repeat protein
MAFDKRKAFQNALNFTQQGKWDKAIAEYQAILRADPRDLTACNSLGDLYARFGRASEAIEQYLKLGELFRADGLAVKAIAVYKKIVKLAPTRIDALLACADLYEEQGLSGEAKIQLAIVAEHYRKKGDTGKLVGVYQRLAQLDPTNHVLITNLGDLLLREGKRELAAAQYELAVQAAQAAGHAGETKRLLKKVHELRPGSPEVSSLTLAEASLRSGRYADAVEVLAKITSTDTRNGEAWRLLGEAYSHLGQAPEAIGALERAMDLGIPEARVQRPLATALVQAGRTAEGIALCQRMAEEAINRGEADEAISDCQGILTVAPQLTSMHSYVAGLLERLGRHEEARAATWAWAAAHEAAGETEAAIQVYRQLLDRDSSDAEARARLEVLEGVPVEEMTPAGEPAQEPAPGPAPDTVAEEAVAATSVGSASLEQGPDLFLEEVVPEEPAALDLSLTMEDAQNLLDEPSLVAREGFEPGLQPSRVIELDETGQIAGTRRATEDPAGGSLDRLAGLHAPGVQFPEEQQADVLSDLEALAAEEEASGEVAEQLAEAEVYLKYGLAEKARERLLEVVRLAPENLVARIRLKDLHLERSQNQDVCRQIAAIARILEARAHWDMALALVRQGLALVPNHPELEGLATKLSGGTAAPVKTPPAAQPVKPADELVQPFEIPETIGAPGDLKLTAVTSAPLEQKVTLDATLGLEEVAVPEAEGLEVAPLDLPSPQRAPQMEGPPFTPTPEEGGEVEPLEDLDKFLSEPSQAGNEASVLEGELPAELRALLEEPGLAEEPALIVEEGEASLDQAMGDDLAEAKFYLSQGMTEEARAVYRRMQARAPEHPVVARLAGELQALPVVGPSAVAEVSAGKIEPTGAPPEDPATVAESPEGSDLADLFDLGGSEVPDAAPKQEAAGGVVKPLKAETSAGRSPQTPTPSMSPPRRVAEHSTPLPGKGHEAAPPGPVTPPAQELPLDQVVPKFSVQHSDHEPGGGGFVNLGAELEEELAAEDRASAGVSSGPLVEDLLKEFQKGVREHLDEKDFETHYNLGIAYKEMQLYDEAIEAFRLAGKDPGRTLACASLIGLCYLAKGEVEAAIREFRAGLDVRGHAREAYHALRYDLGAAHETHGDLERALEVFESLMAEDERFRDIRSRVKGLRERVQQQRAAAVPAAPVEAQVPPQPAKGKKKKISFI